MARLHAHLRRPRLPAQRHQCPAGNETFAYDPLDNVRRAVRGGIDRRFHVTATTQRLSQITTIGSTVLVDFGWNESPRPP